MLSALAALGAVLPGFDSSPALPAQTGTLEGQVVLSPRLSSRRPRFRLYTEYGQPSTRSTGTADINEMANVVIYFAAAPELADRPDGPRLPGSLEVRQEKESFIPHVLPVPVGSTVAFPNRDPLFHNVFSLSKARTFDLGRYPQGASKSVQFDRPGVVQVFCHIHSDMSAVILVTPNRFFTTPDQQGAYRIPDIPPGTYRVTAWHERARPVTAELRVEAGGTTRLDFNIPIADDDAGRR
jgi:plastocyanin